MSIIAYCKVKEEIISQIREIDKQCKKHDKLHGSICLDTSLNIDQGMNSIFLYYEEDRLVSVLSVFMPSAEEAEITACTLPEYRQKGYFNQLLNEAKKELLKYQPIDILYVCEPQSQGGVAAIHKLGAELDFTEYFLRYSGDTSEEMRRKHSEMVLRNAEAEDIESLIMLSQQTFGDEYDNAKSLITKSLESSNRTQYIVTLKGEPIGLAAVSIEDFETSIFGVGILPNQQGKGYGKDLLILLIEIIKKQGIDNITLEVDSSNQNAFHLYKKCGFVVAASYDYYRKSLT
ncbi:MAG: acetyltransferase [Lachnospiraceae bacterium]|nr:acetyltransferase [Lachnospiraceae bacterium]